MSISQQSINSKNMNKLGISSLLSCLNARQDQPRIDLKLSTKVWNLSDKPVELQIKVGSVLKKVHRVKPGSSKRLNRESICKHYMSMQGTDLKRGRYYYEDSCLPRVLISDSDGNFSRLVKQQCISFHDLKDYYEITIFRDHQRGCIAVRKKPRVQLGR